MAPARFKKSGIDPEKDDPERKPPLTKAYLYEIGLSGKENSAELRRKICEHFALPKMLSANALSEILPIITTEEELFSVLEKINEN